MRFHQAAIGVGLLFLALCLIYNVTVPIWEADNEWSHFLYVRYLVDHKALPEVNTAIELPPFSDQCRSGEDVLLNEANHQFRQPPLYYAGAALATAWIDTNDGWSIAANPFRLQDPQNLGRNFALHSADEAFPWRSAPLAVHLVRFYSSLIGLAGLAAAYMLGLLLFSGRRDLAVAVMAVNAFIPQYVFSASTVNNDILVGALGAWCAYCSMRAIYGRTQPLALVMAWAIASLAVLAKYNGLILAPLVLTVTGIALFRYLRSAQEARTNEGMAKRSGPVETSADQEMAAHPASKITVIVAGGLAIVLLALILWFARNIVSHGQLIAGYPSLAIRPGLVSDLFVGTAKDFPSELRYSFVTFWGLMGWGTIPLPEIVVTLLMVVSGICFVGVALYLVDGRESRHDRILVLLLVSFVVLGWLAGGIKRADIASPRGRYLLPAFSTVSFLLILGLKRLLPLRLEAAGRWILVASLLLLTAVAPLIMLRPAYATPPISEDADLLPGEQPLDATIGEFAQLIGYRVEPEHVQIGESLKVTLVWRALQETTNNYVTSMDLLDANQFSHASISTHPGHGNFPTSRWRVGDVFRDTYDLKWTMTHWDAWPGLARIQLRVHCVAAGSEENVALDAVDESGASPGSDLYFGRIKVLQADDQTQERPPGNAAYRFDDQLVLEDFWLSQALPALGRTLEVGLVWRALEQPSNDYGVQIRVIDQHGQQVAGDLLPTSNAYYPVSLWDSGEQVVQMHELHIPLLLPAGDYRILLSVHDPQTGARLPVTNAADQATQTDQLVLYHFNLEETARNFVFMPVVLVGTEP